LAWPWLLAAFALGLWFLAGNLALQYGAARLPANATAVVMVSEVLFASVSAVLLGAGVLTLPLVLGGGLIVLASLLAARG
jgi:drug/metabolite transporter (DMT)-like permease